MSLLPRPPAAVDLRDADIWQTSPIVLESCMVEIGTLSRSGIVTKIYPLTALALELSKPDDAKASASTEAANFTVGTSKKRYADRRGPRNHGQKRVRRAQALQPPYRAQTHFCGYQFEGKGDMQ